MEQEATVTSQTSWVPVGAEVRPGEEVRICYRKHREGDRLHVELGVD